jgi:hypothetical protein
MALESLEFDELLEEVLALIEIGDLKFALRCLQAYVKHGGRELSKAQDYMRRIGNLALDASRKSRELRDVRRAAESLALAEQAGVVKVFDTRSVGALPRLAEFESAAPGLSPTAPPLWRRPHMDLVSPASLSPGDSFRLRVYADQSDPRPGEQAQDIQLPDTGEPFYDLDIRLQITPHFILSGPPKKPFRIQAAEPKTGIVEFALTVAGRDVLDKLEGQAPAVCAEFLYRGRPCGKVARTVEIVGFDMPPAPQAPAALPQLRETVMVSEAVLPDLLVTITTQVENDNRHFWCTVQRERGVDHLDRYQHPGTGVHGGVH